MTPMSVHKKFRSMGPAVFLAICNTYLYKCLVLYICIWKLMHGLDPEIDLMNSFVVKDKLSILNTIREDC